MLYREIIAVCSDNHTEHINTLCGQNAESVSVQPGGTYSDHWALKGNPNRQKFRAGCNKTQTWSSWAKVWGIFLYKWPTIIDFMAAGRCWELQQISSIRLLNERADRWEVARLLGGGGGGRKMYTLHPKSGHPVLLTSELRRRSDQIKSACSSPHALSSGTTDPTWTKFKLVTEQSNRTPP